MNIWQKSSIRFKLMIAISSLMIIVMGLIAVVFTGYSAKKDQEALEKRLKLLADTIMAPAGKYIWDYDNQRLNDLAKKVFEDSEINSVEFLDLKDKAIIKKLEDQQETSEVIHVDILGGDDNKKIATMNLGITHVYLKEKINTQIKLFTFGSLVTILITNLLIYFLISSIVSNLTNATTLLNQRVSNVNGGSQTLNKTSADVLSNTESQASATRETASTLAEITAMVEQNITTVENTTIATSEGQEMANASIESINHMNVSLDQIDSNMKDMIQEANNNTDRIEKMSEIIANIGEKTQIINDIVFQTKLLSFNASVEAARAGEHGKGFAVVAEEVGNLAVLSGKAANDINELLNANKTEVEKIISMSRENAKRIIEKNQQAMQKGMDSSKILETSLKSVLQKVNVIQNHIKNVKAASTEQSEGVKNIHQAIVDIEQSTDSNTVSARKTLEVSNRLKDDALILEQTVSHLLLIVNGEKLPETKNIRETKVHHQTKDIPSNFKKAS